jgi:PKD repeat protein
MVDVKHPVATGFMHKQDSTISAPKYKLTFHDTGFSEYPIASRQWRFHDDTITVYKDSLQQITHFYTTPDTYPVVLKVTDTAGNSHETFKQILVKNYPKAHISGSVTAGQSIVQEGFVVLYESSPGNPASPVDTSDIIVNSGYSYYYFSGVSIFRNYYLRASLRKNDTLFGQYLPTYYGNTSDWTNATILYIDSIYVPAPIKLVACSEEFSTGSGKVSGHVYHLPDSSAAARVSMVLTNSYMNPVEVTTTNDSGYYEFTQLPLHKLNVTPEAAGYHAGTYNVNLTSLQPSIKDVDFYMTDSLFIPDTSTASGLHENLSQSSIDVYPNPAREKLYIQIPSQAEFSQTEILSADGKVLLRKTLNANSGPILLNVSSIEAGFAILKLHGKSGEFFKKIIIQ